MNSSACPSPSDVYRPAIRRPGYYYVALPSALLAGLRDTPLAVGVYALIGRVFRATKAPVPLSPADLCAYDPSISEASAGRALRRLLEKGYLVRARSGGRRNAYHPSWGIVKGEARLWDLLAPSLGRPRHIGAELLPQDLLDHYLGRLEPHAQRGAHVTRYVTAPLLGLADVGAYGLLLAGYAVSRPALSALGLAAEGRALPLPGLQELLALVSQRRLFESESPIALTAAGWARLGLTPPAPAAPSGTPLVFIPPGSHAEPDGDPIAQPIGCPAEPDQPPAAQRRPRGRFVPPCQRSHGLLCGKGSEDHPQPPSQDSARSGGGSTSSTSTRTSAWLETPAATTEPAQSAGAASPAAARLREIGVRRDVAETLAGRPLVQVERVIGLARRHQGVRDVAAWVVGVLRALPAEEPPAAPPPPKVSDLAILTHQGLTNGERTRWLTRFRSADPADRPALLSRFLQEHPLCQS